MPHAVANAALLVASIALAWLATELAARALLGPPRFGPQIAFFHPAPWQIDPRGAVRYRPGSSIRAIAVYGNHVEYDVAFHTNDSGFVDDVDYRHGLPGDRHVAFIGDSFTAGFHGGVPWITLLRAQLSEWDPAIALYNLGVGATGFPNFWTLLESVDRELELDEIVFLFIGGDLYRPLWRPVVRDGAIYPCPVELAESACARRRTGIFELPEGTESAAEIIALARERDVVPPARGLSQWLGRHTQLFARLGLDRPPALPDLRGRPRLEDWLRRLARHYGDRRIRFAQIPERSEVADAAYALDLARPIEAEGFEFVPLLPRCGFGVDHYHRFDGHFDRAGYELLARCLADLLEPRRLSAPRDR